MKIFKYLVSIRENCCFDVPEKAILLDIQVQRGKPVAWFLVDEKEKLLGLYHFEIFMTGQEIRPHGKFITTLQLAGGEFVVHIFRKEPSNANQNS